MGFEWSLTPLPNIGASAHSQLLADFERKGEFYLITQSLNTGKTTAAYSLTDATNRREKWPEDFTLSLTAQQVYLCFHSATSDQSAFIIQLLNDCLHEAGVAGEFEE